jgi:hypothetical protein
MFGGLNRPLAAALVAVVVLVVPPAALACNGGVSAVDVYKECLPTGGGGKPTGGGGGAGSPTGGTQSGTSTPHISKQTAKVLRKAGADKQSLSYLVSGLAGRRVLQAHLSTAAAGEPTAVGSAFDLGSGPTALLIVLAGTAILLLGATGFRSYRRR